MIKNSLDRIVCFQEIQIVCNKNEKRCQSDGKTAVSDAPSKTAPTMEATGDNTTSYNSGLKFASYYGTNFKTDPAVWQTVHDRFSCIRPSRNILDLMRARLNEFSSDFR